MPDRRVNVTLTFATDQSARDVINTVLARLSDADVRDLENANVHEFHLDDPEEDVPTVCLILTDDAVRWADAEAAETIGKGVGGVVVEVPVTADYRKGGTDG